MSRALIDNPSKKPQGHVLSSEGNHLAVQHELDDEGSDPRKPPPAAFCVLLPRSIAEWNKSKGLRDRYHNGMRNALQSVVDKYDPTLPWRQYSSEQQADALSIWGDSLKETFKYIDILL